VDVLGLLLTVVVHAANIQDRAGISLVLSNLSTKYPSIQRIWADSGYNGKGILWVKENTKATLEIVRAPYENFRGYWVAEGAPVPPPPPKGFHLVKHRWVVERTFGWLGRNRQLSKEYDLKMEHSEAWVQLAMIRLMLRRLKKTGNHGYDPEMKKPKVLPS
jgi:putative transposase